MRRMVRRIGIAAATAAMVVGVAGTGARAAGTVNPYTAEGLCGLGFRTVDQDPIHDSATGVRLGTVHLLHNPFTGYGCAVTLKSAYVGVPTRTQVYLDPEWASFTRDDGDRRYAAGPVHAFVQGGCVIWGGLMEDGSGVHLHDRANPAIGGAVTCF